MQFNELKQDLRSWNSKSRDSTQMVNLRQRLSVLSFKESKLASKGLMLPTPRPHSSSELETSHSNHHSSYGIRISNVFVNANARSSLPIYQDVHSESDSNNIKKKPLTRILIPEPERAHSIQKSKESISGGATIDGLVDKLLSVHSFGKILFIYINSKDPEFMDVFIMLYRKFIEPIELLDRLLDKWEEDDQMHELNLTLQQLK